MGEACKIIAKVTVDGAAHLGKHPEAGFYICASSGVYFPASAPAVCTATTVATAVGKWASTPASKALMEKAAQKGCEIAVKAGEEVTEILIVQGRAAGQLMERKSAESKATYNALNTPQGIEWLMRYMSR